MGRIFLEFIEDIENKVWCCASCFEFNSETHISSVYDTNDYDIETSFGVAFKCFKVINLIPTKKCNRSIIYGNSEITIFDNDVAIPIPDDHYGHSCEMRCKRCLHLIGWSHMQNNHVVYILFRESLC